MVKVIDQKSYKCDLCDKIYSTAELARKCQEGHDLVYVAIERSDLKRLIQFIYSKEEEVLTPTLMDTLHKYARMKVE